jgi:prepilin-type processing-associated H-X9-DG protein
MNVQTSDPKHVDISLSQGVNIVWLDGHQSQYQLEYLRKNCPCATCRNVHGTGTPAAAAAVSAFPMFKAAMKLTSVEAVGRYAVRLQWNDGHNTGIYSFNHLREICPCEECRASGAPTSTNT